MTTQIVKCLCSVLVISALPLALLAGPLAPPGPPGPTFKTLDEMEPRRFVKANTEVIEPIVINQSGSYYLTEDVTAIPDNNAITISASNVTLDLNGFTVNGNLEVNDGHGIYITGVNVTVRNGTVQFADQDGVHCFGARLTKLIDVSSMRNGGTGVTCGFSHIVRGDFFYNASNGITGTYMLIEGVKVESNLSFGITAGNSNITNSHISGNQSGGVICHTPDTLVTNTLSVNNLVTNSSNCTKFNSHTP